MSKPATPQSPDPRLWHRHFAALFFNRTWELLEQDDRTAEEDQEMLAATFASRAHWRKVGEPVNHAIGDWQISRVFIALDELEQARQYAESSRAWCMDYALPAFYHAYAYEALARTAANAGRHEDARKYIEQARQFGENIEKAEERDLLLADLQSIAIPVPDNL